MAIIEGIRQGLSALQSPVRIVGVILWSLVLWVLSALSFWVMFAAFGIPVSFAGALLMQSLIMFGIAVPSTPGYLGVFEAPIIAVLGLYHVDASLAATYAFTYHATTFLPITLLGAWSVVRTNIGLRHLRQSAGVSTRCELAAHAKVNLCLRVLAREADGYHSVETLFCRISLADTLRAERIGRGSRYARGDRGRHRTGWTEPRGSRRAAWCSTRRDGSSASTYPRPNGFRSRPGWAAARATVPPPCSP